MQNKKPHIIYWKWNDDLLDINLVRKKTYDIIKRSIFDVIYVSLHSVSEKNQVLYSDNICTSLAECAKILNENNRKLVLDLNIKSEVAYLKMHPLPEKDYMVMYVKEKLDKNGSLTINIKDCNGIMAAKAVSYDSNRNLIEDSITDITEFAENNGETIFIDAGEAYADKDVVLFPTKDYIGYDICGDDYKEHRRMMFERVKNIGISGGATDEWGQNIFVEIEMNDIPRTGNQMDYMAELKKTVDLDTAPFVAKWFHISDGLCKYYKKTYGSDLKEDMIWFRANSTDNKSENVVNQYIKTIRERIVDGDVTFYDEVKKYFGKDAYVMCHPTWWGDELDSNFESIRNGLDWWEVKRDFSQTDEMILMPVRMSMARKCEDNIWYNMWYSMRTLDIKTYYRETWINARYGGRTHYLGYECYEPGVVLTLCEEGRLESVSKMEEEIEKLNAVQISRPDSRILIVFGYEAVSNWHISEPTCDKWQRISPIFHNVWSFAKNLFDKNYLCEIVPSYEIENGNLILEKQNISYCGHSYDALVVLYPIGMPEAVSEKIEKFEGLMAVIGDERNRFTECNRFDVPDADVIFNWLLENDILQNCGENYCIYEDGSIVFTTDGEKNVGNELKIFCKIGEYNIEFVGEDFLYINANGAVAFGKKKILRLNGDDI